MIAFMFLSIILLIAVLWLIAPALLGKRNINKDDTDTQNTEIAKERLADLELRLEQNEVSQDEFEQTKIEIEKSLLQDIRDGEEHVKPSPKIERNAYVIITAIPLMALALYWLWGSPNSINLNTNMSMSALKSDHATNSAAASSDGKPRIGSVDEMVALLEKKLLQEPSNANGWYTLGRTYMSLKRYDKAIAAFRHLHSLVGDDATVLITLADAMTMANKGSLLGEPFVLVKKALILKPNDPTALWLAGLGYEETGDEKTAIKMWKKLLPLISNEPRSVQQIQSLIVAAERKMGIAPSIVVGQPVGMAATAPLALDKATNTSANTTASITVTVELSEEMKARTSPNDFVLVYARATQGPRMPLAIVKKQVKDLPLTVTLNDSMAMSPAMKMSNFPKVNILARVSKSGQAMPQSGDMLGQVGPVAVSGAEAVTVTVNKQLP